MSSSGAGHVLTHRLRDTPCQKACHLPVTTVIDNVDSECDEKEVLDVPSLLESSFGCLHCLRL